MVSSAHDFAVAYLKDILLKSEKPKDHKKNVFEVFRKTQDYGFRLKEEKCDFF